MSDRVVRKVGRTPGDWPSEGSVSPLHTVQMGREPLLDPTGATIDRSRPPRALVLWSLIGGGAVVALIGALLGIVALTQYHAVATVEHQGPCVNSASAGLVCTERVTYVAHDGKSYSAVMKGVHPDEVHGPAAHRTLAITYTSGSESSPTTDDMPNAVPIGLLLAGIALIAWGFWVRGRNPDREERPAVATKR